MTSRPRRGLRANVVAAFAAGALLISLILAFSTYFSARHYLIVQRKRNALQQAYIDAALVKERLRTNGVNVAEVGKRLAERGIAMSGPAGPGTITFGVNETWNRMSAADLIRAFEQALA